MGAMGAQLRPEAGVRLPAKRPKTHRCVVFQKSPSLFVAAEGFCVQARVLFRSDAFVQACHKAGGISAFERFIEHLSSGWVEVHVSIVEFEQLFLLLLMICFLLYRRETKARRGDREQGRLSEDAEKHESGFIDRLSTSLD